MRRKNFPGRKTKRREAAVARQAHYQALSLDEKLAQVVKRQKGKATREVTRLVKASAVLDEKSQRPPKHPKADRRRVR
jgi:hypothetical protein